MRTSVSNYMKLLLMLVAVLTVIATPLELLATNVVSVIPPPLPMEGLTHKDTQQSKPLPGQFALAVDTVYFNFDNTLEGWSFSTSPDTVAITYADAGCNQVGRLERVKYPFDLYWDNGTLKYVAYHHGYNEHECDYEFWSKAIWAPVGPAWDGSKRLEARIYNEPYYSYSVWARFGYQKAGDTNTYYPGGSTGWFPLANNGWTTIFLDEPLPGEFSNLDRIAITMGAYYNEGNIYVDWVRGITQRVTVLHVPSEEYPTIQSAINASTDGDTILVAPSTYTGDGNRDLYMPWWQIVLKSESGPDNTIIDCEGSSDDQHRGLYLDYYGSPDNVVDGFTFRGGYDQYGNGGAIWIDNVSPKIKNCTFENNSGHALNCTWAYPIVSNCRFIGNTGDYGGAVRCSGGEAQFTNCTFENNSAQYNGGALYCTWSSPKVTDCLFDGNSAQQGGAISSLYYPEDAGSSMLLANCTFVKNSANTGAGIYLDTAGTPSILNCIIAFSPQGEAIYVNGAGGPTLFCCDIFANAGGDWTGDIASQQGVNGNFSLDPFFCDFANGNYQITGNSPCAAANNSCKALIGLYDVGCGATEIALSPLAIVFSAIEGGANPSPENLTIKNSGGGTLNWELSKSKSWLDVSSTEGTAPSVVVVSADISALSANEYYDTITVYASNAVNSPQDVPVTLDVQPLNRPPEFVDTCRDTVLEEGQIYSCQIVVSDPDGDSIKITWNHVPNSAEFTDNGDGTADFLFQPDYRHVDSSYMVIFEAFDYDTSVVDTMFINVTNRQLIAKRVPPPDKEILISDSIVVEFNEAVRESSLPDNVVINSYKAAPIAYRYDDSQTYSLIIGSSLGLLKELDTIEIQLHTGILDSAIKPIDKEYSAIVYTGVAVFPGDANNDGIVDERDILPMGLYWGNVGPAREVNPDLTPQEIPAHTFVPQLKWTPMIAVYTDADGSGLIDANDICGVTENWAQTHSVEGAGKVGGISDIVTLLKQFEGDVLRQMYEALINCPESEGRETVMRALEPLLGEREAVLPTTYELSQNYPNPFNPYTSIQFYLPQGGHVTLSVYNIMGQKVAVLVDGYRDKGYGEVIWDGVDQSGNLVASGIYFYRLKIDDIVITKRMMLLK